LQEPAGAGVALRLLHGPGAHGRGGGRGAGGLLLEEVALERVCRRGWAKSGPASAAVSVGGRTESVESFGVKPGWRPPRACTPPGSGVGIPGRPVPGGSGARARTGR